MLELLVADEFAKWFGALDDATAEDVATALDMVEQLGVERAPPASRGLLLWYEHASVVDFAAEGTLAWQLEAWGTVRDYASRILERLESARFAERLSRAGTREANHVLWLLRDLRRIVDPRAHWAVGGARLRLGVPDADPCAELRRRYLAVLEAAGFAVVDVPAYTSGLHELSRRVPGPAYRVLYGVDVARNTAVFVLGEHLDRSFYGDSVRRAEALWKSFLAGSLAATPAAEVR